MSASASILAQRAAELRSAFDRNFAVAVRTDAAVKHDLIAIRVGGEPFALRLAEIGGLIADRKITRVMGGNGALLGLIGFRGALVPVYGLQKILGHSGAPASRWLVIAAAAPMAFAFDAFEGHLRVPADAIVPQQSPSSTRGYAPDFIRAADAVRPVIHLPAVIAALGASAASRVPFIKE
jgi:chemotaxis signal transduction protein